ncbi:hypothetical protein OG342_14945 [Streptomyces bobili]|uniref:hypothetical protein n=1 Tax=Streptomyces bobili TaxID=67280 RepID=UPI00225BBB3F|nr:hypothetical protein [Streptomyces bobili]MCX5524152.1 hypothetical protein [Streptomyces bobili]
MADDMAARLMAKMRGNREGAPVEPTKLDPTTAALMEQASRGSADYSSVHEANAKGQAQFQAAVQKRARELVGQHGLSWSFAEARALRELREEQRVTNERDRRRATHEAMRENTRREGEATSTASLRGDIRQSTTQRREKADATLVAALQAITGAHR